MKKLLTFCLAAALSLNLVAIPATAAESTIFEYDFESYLPNTIKLSKSQRVEVVEDELNEKDHAVVLEKNGKQNPDDAEPTIASMEVNIPSQSSTFTMEFDYMYKGGQTWVQMFNNNDWPYGPAILFQSNSVSAWNGPSLSRVDGVSFNSNDWLRIAIEANPATKKYKLFINGKQAFENDFRSTTMSAVNKVAFKNPADVADGYFYVDNIIFYTGTYNGVASEKVNMSAPNPQSEAYKAADESRYIFNAAPIMQEYFVDSNASEGGIGTAQSPFNTIERAINAVKKSNDKMNGDIIVNIKDGEYYIDSTINMTDDDSATNGFNIIYKGETPGGVKISGAKKLTGWTKHTDSIWKVPLEDAAYTLYQDSRRSIKARYPNREFDKDYITHAGPYLVNTDKDNMKTHIKANPNDIKNISFKDITDAKLCIWPWWNRDWSRYTLSIHNVNKTTGLIDCDDSDVDLGEGARYYIEGMLELLDAEGEFHYDSDEKMLYYMPYGNKNPNTECTVYAPKVTELINITGKSLTPVNNIVFENISFEKTNFLGHIKSWQNINSGWDIGAVTLDTTNDIKFLNCRFKNTGLSGLYIKGHSNYNYVYNCLFENIGLSGVILLSKDRNVSEYLRHNRISNCIMHDLGELSIDCAGVNIWSSQGTVVENCEIYNSPRSAYSLRAVCWEGSSTSNDNNLVGGRARHNILRNTIIYDVDQDSGDNGAVHTAAISYPGEVRNVNYFENIFVDSIYAHESMKDQSPNGYFGDYFSNHQSFKNMKVTNEAGQRNSYINSSFTNNTQIRYNTTDQNSVSFENSSWITGFDESKMNYNNMGVSRDYPFELTPDYDLIKQAVILQQGASAAINHGSLTYIDTNNHAVQPVNVSDRLLVPIRFIAESFGAQVSWADPVATVKLGSNVVEITKDSKIIKINGADKEIDVAATILNDRTMVPLRAVAEALGKEVNYYNGLVVITDVKGLFDEIRDNVTISNLGNDLYYEYNPEKFSYNSINHKYQDFIISGTSLKDGEAYMLRTSGSFNAECYSVSRENGKVRLTIKENNYAIPYFREFDTAGADIKFIRDNGYLSILIDGTQVFAKEFTRDSLLYGTYNGANTLVCDKTGLGIIEIDQTKPIEFLLPYNQLGIGQVGTYYITAKDKSGNMLDLTHQGIEISNSNPAVASISGGSVKALTPGTTTFTATVDINGKTETLSADFTVTEKADVLLKADFNLGSTSLIGWTLNGFGTTIIKTSDDNRLYLWANTGVNINAEAQFIRPYSGKFSVECDFQVNFNPDRPSEGATPIYVHGGGAYAISTFAMNGQWGYYDSSIPGIRYVAPIESGRNYRLKCIADTETDTFDFYVDGELIMDDATFRNKVDSVNKIAFGTGGEPQNTEVYWDNVEIKAILD